jgi:hypothetical protein
VSAGQRILLPGAVAGVIDAYDERCTFRGDNDEQADHGAGLGLGGLGAE